MRVAIAGAGNVGRSIAAELIENGHEVLLIDKDPHQLGDGDGGMGVVQLHRPARVELVEGLAAGELQPEDVLQRTGHEEVLLRQPQPLARFRFVVGIQDLRDRLGRDLLVDRAVVVAGVERVECE